MNHSIKEMRLSTAIGEYQLLIYNSDKTRSQARYPIIYILDGASYFHTLAAYLNKLTQSDRAYLKHCVLVGIDYPDQTRRDQDYLPCPAHFKPEMRDGVQIAAPNYGGADAFLTLIETEVKPLIEMQHPIDRHSQTLFGHSYGGICTLYALLTRTQMFTHYFAASPSLWFSDRYLFSLLPDFMTQQSSLQHLVRCFLSVGEYEQSLAPEDAFLSAEKQAQLKKHRAARNMVDLVSEFVQRLKANQTPFFDCQFKLYSNENHISAGFCALHDLLKFSLQKEIKD